MAVSGLRNFPPVKFANKYHDAKVGNVSARLAVVHELSVYYIGTLSKGKWMEGPNEEINEDLFSPLCADDASVRAYNTKKGWS